MEKELLEFTASSMKKGLHMLFICVMFPLAMWLMITFFAGESINQHLTYVYAGTGAICLIIFLIGALPHITKNRRVKIAVNKQRIQIYFTDYEDYELSISEIKQIKVNSAAQRTTMKDYFIVDSKGRSYRLPHYYDVPINKIINLLMQLNPQIERVGRIHY